MSDQRDDVEADPFPTRHGRHVAEAEDQNGNGGWPDLSEEPVAMPELSEMPAPLELARAYAQVTVHQHRLWPRVVKALNYLYQGVLESIGKATHAKRAADKAHGAVEGLQDTLRSLVKQVRGIATKLEVEETEDTGAYRRKLPSLSEYDAELTPHGGIKISPEAWQQVQERIHHLDGEAAESRRKAELAAARQIGAQRVIAENDARFEKWKNRAKLTATIGGPVVAGLAWLATHFLHW